MRAGASSSSSSSRPRRVPEQQQQGEDGQPDAAGALGSAAPRTLLARGTLRRPGAPDGGGGEWGGSVGRLTGRPAGVCSLCPTCCRSSSRSAQRCEFPWPGRAALMRRPSSARTCLARSVLEGSFLRFRLLGGIHSFIAGGQRRERPPAWSAPLPASPPPSLHPHPRGKGLRLGASPLLSSASRALWTSSP